RSAILPVGTPRHPAGDAALPAVPGLSEHCRTGVERYNRPAMPAGAVAVVSARPHAADRPREPVMTDERGIDPTHRTFVSYIDKSREYYLAQGFGNPYRWATHDDAPFVRLTRPVADCRVALVTTASRIEPDGAPTKAVYSHPSADP